MTDLGPFEIDNIYCGQSEELLAKLPDDCIDMTCTSPPYDGLREYNGFTLDWREIIRQLYRVTKPGGVCVWVVADATIDGSETGTSFKQALWAMECGFNLHDTMIFNRAGQYPDTVRYYADFEYMFVFSKGKPESINLIKDKKNKYAGDKIHGTDRDKNGELRRAAGEIAGRRTNEYGVRSNIWKYATGGNGVSGDKFSHDHAATFPEALARDHILSWSKPGDLVLDCFVGSGTTAKMAYQNGRHYLGFDCSPEYVELAKKRVAWANPPLLVVG